MSKSGNILIIADTHIPFEHRHYLEFCSETKRKFKCSKIYHAGDVVDHHSISSHNHCPDGFSPLKELEASLKKLKKWYKAFPKVNVCIGNHDERIERAAAHFGLSSSYFRSLRDIYGFPKTWDYRFDHYVYGIRIFHGMGYSGKYAHVTAAIENQRSVVIGHMHSNAGSWYSANETDIVFGLAVGCGIDRNSYAFRYGRDFRRKPILGAGVVLEGGKRALFVPMKL